MHFHPDFEAVQSQLLNPNLLPSFDDVVHFVIVEGTHLSVLSLGLSLLIKSLMWPLHVLPGYLPSLLFYQLLLHYPFPQDLLFCVIIASILDMWRSSVLSLATIAGAAKTPISPSASFLCYFSISSCCFCYSLSSCFFCCSTLSGYLAYRANPCHAACYEV